MSSSNSNNSVPSNLGNGGTLGTPATIPTTSLPGNGTNQGSSSNNSAGRTPTSPGPGDLGNNNSGRSTPTSPSGNDLPNTSRGPAAAANISSELASLSIGSSATLRSAAFESSRLDLWWTQSSSSLEQRSSSNGFNVERGDQDATDATRAKLAKADRSDDADDWREDDSSADELDSQESSTRDKQRGVRREQRGHRFSTGLRGRMAWDRDWSDLAQPAEDAVDAILAALERSTNDAEVVEDAVEEGGLVEVIVAAAADRPLVD